MATCKDCVHCEVCKKRHWHIIESQYMYQMKDVEIRCEHYKNKADVVSKKAYEQVKWERDTAIEQLNSYGVDFCEEADVVPVVRCSQCKHKCWVQEPCHGKSMDWCKLHDICIKETDYCSYGERKD